MEQVLEIKGTPSLRKMSLNASTEKMRLILVKWLIEANDLMDLKKPMTENQIIMGANTILEDHDNLNTNDLTLFFKKLIKGHYGQFYESFSIDKLDTALRKYQEERFENAANRSLANHKKFVSGDIQGTFLQDKKREKKRNKY